MGKELNQMKANEIFTFTEKGLKYGICNLDGCMSYRTCNGKVFKFLSNSQFIQVEQRDKKDYHSGETIGNYWKEIGEIINCFICGRGENKSLFYKEIEIIG